MARQDTEGEDFWNSSSIKSFNFDDDEPGGGLFGVSKSGTARLSQQVRASLPGEEYGGNNDSLTGSTSTTSSNTAPPLHTLISEKCLTAIMDADYPDTAYGDPVKRVMKPEEEIRMLKRQVQERWDEPPVELTIKHIFLGRPHSLESYRSLSSKRALLDAAINLGDGNAILAVILFLVQTLKKSLLHQILASNPVAATHYARYLATRLQAAELTDLLVMLGKSRDAAMKQYQLCSSTQNVQRQIQKLRSCISSHFVQGDSPLKKLAQNHVALLEWELAVGEMDKENLIGKSAVECLAHACRLHWEDPRGSPTNPFALAQLHGINEKQLHWTILSERASQKAWPDIDSVFITKNWIGSGSKLKLAIPIDKVVIQLHSKGAPNDVLSKYLGFVDSYEKRIALAQKIGCHKTVIDSYAALRDRQGIQGYKATLHPGSEEFLHAEGVLRVSTTKWKN
ncbi:spermatogenesis-defective protein 39 homolog [Frankliniella occidentalis]|uniref:Spermatogenesis-defective protein 39 homolog n=1 Tax=Frankliniella occidentalis TaxID=133901 RepID=A0A6J1TSB3_FRAOC|nr:spermatogenesis-defective protein 39 homolog [Frankliniella occidentalis]XP_026293561.1 spermatogenesis-defective protein 39 homolog [Frankliniella occidentalis]XP_052128360.1 spermatogenesis-defective protein 39 homolog [Frankliniella occidentalis]